ncbi:MAG: hypothetical protein JNJ71_03020 [Rubrivivax sp.]|nr:hypothetical protein [Rubrivivax sp.]
MNRFACWPLAALLMLSTAAQAHEGHGLSGSHWHVTDSFGLLLGALAAMGAWMLWRGRR